MSELIIRDLQKSYGKKKVLEGLDLTLESGKIYGLLGRNGAGKTTLLSLLSAQALVTSGSVTLDGEPVWENPRALEKICFARELNPAAGSGFDTMKVGAYLKTASWFYPHWDKTMADRLLEQFRLDPKAKMKKLSKGMLSMVTILVALASKAEFTFLDEPTAGLDIVAREQFYKLLLEEYTESGRTFVISTHIIEEASDVMEEVLILKDGKLPVRENTQQLLGRAVQVSGLQEEVDRAVEGLRVVSRETLGRRATAAVLLEEGQQIPAGREITEAPMTLEQIFVALCRED